MSASARNDPVPSCYISHIMLRRVAVMVVLAVLASGPMRMTGQTPNSTTASKPSTAPATRAVQGSAPQSQSSTTPGTTAGAEATPEGNLQSATPQIIVNPPPA